jgi:hypothetical protein
VKAQDISIHVRSKSDLYHVLAIENQIHLPAFDEITMFFLKEVLSGRKKVLHLREISPCNVPRLREFSADKLYALAMEDEVLQLYLPDPNEKKKRPISRRFLFNVSQTPGP